MATRTQDFTAAGLQDEAAIAVAERTFCRLDDTVKGAIVNVGMRDGLCVTRRTSMTARAARGLCPRTVGEQVPRLLRPRSGARAGAPGSKGLSP